MSKRHVRYYLHRDVSLLSSLRRRENRLLVLLQASIAEGQTSMRELPALLSSESTASALQSIRDSWERQVAVREAIEEGLCEGIGAPLDSDEIEVLARALDGIPRAIKKFATRYDVCGGRVNGADFQPQLTKLEEAVGAVAQMVAGLSYPRLSTTKRLHDLLQRVEGEADQLFVARVVELLKRQHEPLTAMMLRDLHGLLERAIDRCRTAGNLILRIVLKHT